MIRADTLRRLLDLGKPISHTIGDRSRGESAVRIRLTPCKHPGRGFFEVRVQRFASAEQVASARQLSGVTAAEGLLAELAEFIALVRAGDPAASLAASELFVEAAQLQYDDGFVELLNSDPYWQKPTTNAAANLIAAYFRAVAIWAAGKGRT